jgi:hypothetical protein
VVTGWEQLARSLEAAFGEEFVTDFMRTLQDEERAKNELVFSRARAIARASERLEACAREGVGQCHMRLDPRVWAYWARREGPQIWNERSFVKAFKRDNPEVRVKPQKRKTTVLKP